ncbi:ketopantoate reductase family protein [Streptacidiphilus anmyonensis]|uniref:ketopantoate reductase family protein n=1 Tax=Streptacidiphilus anmyonensis TaxID=405782 RepID=UPI0005A9E4A1|nr:2-dehydropantoate 2-reductase [Streptacidiphilus anmyonensis]
MRILVVGAGATGGFFGGRLALAGRDVTFLVRPGRAAALRERGLRIVGAGLGGPEQELRPRLVLPGEVDGPYDVVLLSVKAGALAQSLEDVAPAVGPGTVIVPFLNGMAHLAAIERRFGPDVALGGMVRVAGTLDDDGDVRVLSRVSESVIADMTLGELAGGTSARIERIGKELSDAGFGVVVSPDILGVMWGKWAFISALGALTTLMRGSVGEVVRAGGGWLGPALLTEAAAVAAAAGHPLTDTLRERIAASLTRADSPDTASLYRDTAAGRPTEGEHILGDLTARARELGVDTPLLDLAALQLRVHGLRLAAG